MIILDRKYGFVSMDGDTHVLGDHKYLGVYLLSTPRRGSGD